MPDARSRGPWWRGLPVNGRHAGDGSGLGIRGHTRPAGAQRGKFRAAGRLVYCPMLTEAGLLARRRRAAGRRVDAPDARPRRSVAG